MKGKIKWHIAGRLVRALGLAVLGVAADQAALDGATAQALAAVFDALPLLFGSSSSSPLPIQ